MKFFKMILIASVVSGTAMVAPAQQRPLSPGAQQDVQRLLEAVQALRLVEQNAPQRGGAGGRGLPVLPETYKPTVGRFLAQLGGAWWTNPATITRLGITDEQKTKLDRAFENHRQKLESSKDLLEKEEAQLARLLQTETIDRNAVLTQIDRVVQARGEMERANSAMTLEMRESLTLAQWLQVQQQPTWSVRPYQSSPSLVPAPGQRGGAGGRGGRGGGPPQQ